MNDQVNEDKNIGNAVVDLETDWRSLRSVDAQIAERVMGWSRHPDAMHPTDNRTIDGVLYCPPGRPWDCNMGNVVPGYSSDISAAVTVENRMMELGIQNKYALELARILPAWRNNLDMSLLYWQLAHASALDRCRAALAATECLPISALGTNGPAS